MKQSTSSADKREQEQRKAAVGAMSTHDDPAIQADRGKKDDPNAPKTEAERTGGGNPRGPAETQHSTDTGADKGRTNAPASGQPSGGDHAPKKAV